MPRNTDFYRALQEKTKSCTPDEFQELTPKFGDDKELCKALRERAYSCSIAEFKELLLKFGGDDACLDAMQKAVDARGKVEDRGSYCEDSTPGYNTYVRKTEMLMDCRLEMGAFKGVFNRSAANNNTPKASKAAMIERLCELVEDLSERLERLENAATINPSMKPPRNG